MEKTAEQLYTDLLRQLASPSAVHAVIPLANTSAVASSSAPSSRSASSATGAVVRPYGDPLAAGGMLRNVTARCSGGDSPAPGSCEASISFVSRCTRGTLLGARGQHRRSAEALQ